MRRVTTAAAVARVLAAVDRRMESWRALNMQVQWSIDDEVYAAVPGLDKRPRYVQAMVKTLMEDGRPWFWQRFLMRPDAERRAAIEAAAAQVPHHD